MEITTKAVNGAIEVHLQGRLDGYWADHLSRSLEETMRGGHHHVRLNMSEIVYLSSLGIRVLVSFYKKVQAVEGTFVVSGASEEVRKVLDMVGLSARLIPSDAPTAATQPITVPPSRTLDRDSAVFEIFNVASASLSCELTGDPDLLTGCRFTERDCRGVRMPADSFAFGLGALGAGFPECRNRFGEFLAVAGAAAYQPTDGSNVPDFQLAEGTLVPEMQVLYGAVCSGSLGTLARFESKPERAGVGLAELADTALEISGAERAGIVCVAESAGLVGASLRRSPVTGANGGAPFTHPEIRNWLSFTTERAYARALAVVVGVAARQESGELGGLLRPMSGTGIYGHFHAATFSYRPLQKGVIDLNRTVRSLFDHETLQGILHLIGDDRDAVGVSESEFVRGACWIGPITESGVQWRPA
ncbi:MAG: STAS domain-containing protein [Bryobacteraceae bacterium]